MVCHKIPFVIYDLFFFSLFFFFYTHRVGIQFGILYDDQGWALFGKPEELAYPMYCTMDG